MTLIITHSPNAVWGVKYWNFKSVHTQIRYSPQRAGSRPAQPLLPCKPGCCCAQSFSSFFFFFLNGNAAEQSSEGCSDRLTAFGRAMVLSAGQAAARQGLSISTDVNGSQPKQEANNWGNYAWTSHDQQTSQNTCSFCISCGSQVNIQPFWFPSHVISVAVSVWGCLLPPMVAMLTLNTEEPKNLSFLLQRKEKCSHACIT